MIFKGAVPRCSCSHVFAQFTSRDIIIRTRVPRCNTVNNRHESTFSEDSMTWLFLIQKSSAMFWQYIICYVSLEILCPNLTAPDNGVVFLSGMAPGDRAAYSWLCARRSLHCNLWSMECKTSSVPTWITSQLNFAVLLCTCTCIEGIFYVTSNF